HIERHYGRFMRRFTLPEDVDADRIEAKCELGVLHITLPKTADSSPRRIEVR
ncbi:MAG TPA: Hsp20/alpha crystallin family protein, partial [Halothiobacillaceae bacterium]|nr:Hsp20/alpha crystallin family protein [Halothiobacillaceae bacterium]